MHKENSRTAPRFCERDGSHHKVDNTPAGAVSRPHLALITPVDGDDLVKSVPTLVYPNHICSQSCNQMDLPRSSLWPLRDICIPATEPAHIPVSSTLLIYAVCGDAISRDSQKEKMPRILLLNRLFYFLDSLAFHQCRYAIQHNSVVHRLGSLLF